MVGPVTNLSSYLLYLLSDTVFCPPQVSCEGDFDMWWLQYTNAKGLTADGEVCDGRWGISLSQCDHYFTVCVDDLKRYTKSTLP